MNVRAVLCAGFESGMGVECGGRRLCGSWVVGGAGRGAAAMRRPHREDALRGEVGRGLRSHGDSVAAPMATFVGLWLHSAAPVGRGGMTLCHLPRKHR